MSIRRDNLNRVKYSGADFATHSDEIMARLQVKFATAFNDFSASSLGIMLIDVFAFGLDTLSFYLDRRATDNFLSTARTRRSAARAARQLGYKPSGATASSVDIEVTLNESYDFPVTLPRGFRFVGPGGLLFEAQESQTWQPGVTQTKTITASEGETRTVTFTSDGSPNQVFELAGVPEGKFIVAPGTDGESQTDVIVDGEEWEEVEILTFGENNEYEIGYNDDPPTLRFGDGIAGNIPEDGSEIRLTYFATSGVNSRAAENTITDTEEDLVVNFTPISMTVNNPSSTSGGSNPESLDSIKANATSVFKSRGANITAEDYRSRATSFSDSTLGSIAVAEAISVRGSSDDAFLSSRLENIVDESRGVEPQVRSSHSSISSYTQDINSEASTAESRAEEVEEKASSINQTKEDLKSIASDMRGSANILQVNSNDVVSDSSKLKNEIDDIQSDDNDDKLTDETRNKLKRIISGITAKGNESSSESSSMVAHASDITDDLRSIGERNDEIKELSNSIRENINTIESKSSSISSNINNLNNNISDISSKISVLVNEVDEHVDSFLSNECKSNLVEVTVLTQDPDGFYVVPSIGLMSRLQRYLDRRKEVTQVVKVVGGDHLLVPANIDVFVGVELGFREASVRAEVEENILRVLKRRKFGDPLRLSELYAPIAPTRNNVRIDGVDFVNIKIVSPSDKLDPDGNLIVSNHEVVTKGSIDIKSETVE